MYVPNFLGTSREGAVSSNGPGSPRGYVTEWSPRQSGYSRKIDEVISKSGRSTDAQYGMSILKTWRYDVDTSSQEAIVSKECTGTRSEFDFGLQDDSKKVAR
jgi:hypothetical protein